MKILRDSKDTVHIFSKELDGSENGFNPLEEYEDEETMEFMIE